MTATKLSVAIIILVCLAVSSLLPHKSIALTPLVATAGGAPRLAGAPPLRLAKTRGARYDPSGCRTACERKGFWGADVLRLVNACKVGCSLGNNYCQ